MSTMKVLLIDDEAPIVAMYNEKLSKEGFNVLTAANGIIGIQIAKKERPDVILLDIIMPKLNGLDVLKELKNEPTTKDIPVYLLTNIQEETGEDRGKQFGAAGYLFKAETEPGELVRMLKGLKK
jgi:CheY-like chemotaxis protein